MGMAHAPPCALPVASRHAGRRHPDTIRRGRIGCSIKDLLLHQRLAMRRREQARAAGRGTGRARAAGRGA